MLLILFNILLLVFLFLTIRVLIMLCMSSKVTKQHIIVIKNPEANVYVMTGYTNSDNCLL